MHSTASESTDPPKWHARTFLSCEPPCRTNPAGRQQIASSTKEIIKVPRKEDFLSSCASSGLRLATAPCHSDLSCMFIFIGDVSQQVPKPIATTLVVGSLARERGVGVIPGGTGVESTAEFAYNWRISRCPAYLSWCVEQPGIYICNRFWLTQFIMTTPASYCPVCEVSTSWRKHESSVNSQIAVTMSHELQTGTTGVQQLVSNLLCGTNIKLQKRWQR
jgi:hypothetical protein